jgi:glycosyltransferase involved in cell wall biosynthesis
MSRDIGNLISVCLLTYNHAHLIESTINSIQNQTLSGYEIIVSDDCSTDETWSILQRLSLADSRIRPIRTPRNLGMPENANFAVEQCERPYIALLHHDDLCQSDLLEKWIGVMERNSEVGFVFNEYGVDCSNFVWRETFQGECISGKDLLENYLFPRWGCVVRGTAMIRRSAWDAVGGMRPMFGLLADIDLWMRLAMIGAVGFVPEPLLLLRDDRPEDYPEEYKSIRWSWPRQRYLYEIHAANRLSYYGLKNFTARLQWLRFRLRLSMETAKWLTYGVVRKTPDMITSSNDSETTYDFMLLRWYRFFLQKLYSH